MEIASHIREFFLDKHRFTPHEEELIPKLQVLHVRYIAIMNSFSNQMNKLALDVSPEVRIGARQLKIDIYQDWKELIVQQFFADPAISPLAESEADRLLRLQRQMNSLSVDSSDSDSLCIEAVHRVEQSLKRFEKRLDDYVTEGMRGGKRFRTPGSLSLSPDSSRLCDLSNVSKHAGDKKCSEFIGSAPR